MDCGLRLQTHDLTGILTRADPPVAYSGIGRCKKQNKIGPLSESGVSCFLVVQATLNGLRATLEATPDLVPDACGDLPTQATAQEEDAAV
jgi:hypothetical protein